MDTDKIKVKSEGYIIFIRKLPIKWPTDVETVCALLSLLSVPVAVVNAEWFVFI